MTSQYQFSQSSEAFARQDTNRQADPPPDANRVYLDAVDEWNHSTNSIPLDKIGRNDLAKNKPYQEAKRKFQDAQDANDAATGAASYQQKREAWLPSLSDEQLRQYFTQFRLNDRGVGEKHFDYAGYSAAVRKQRDAAAFRNLMNSGVTYPTNPADDQAARADKMGRQYGSQSRVFQGAWLQPGMPGYSPDPETNRILSGQANQEDGPRIRTPSKPNYAY